MKNVNKSNALHCFNTNDLPEPETVNTQKLVYSMSSMNLLLKSDSITVLVGSKILGKGGFTQHSFFFHFRSFFYVFLLDKICAFSSAFLYVHIRTKQTVTYWTKVFRK